MKRVKYNFLAILIMALFAGILILGNVFYAKISVAAVPGSYAESFAREKQLNLVEIPDSMKWDLDLRYEIFEYNMPDNGAVLERYDGVGKEVVIPEEYDGHKVIGLSDDFFVASDIEKLYIPASVSAFPEEVDDSVTLMLPDSSPLREELIEKGWKVETYADSEAPYFDMSAIPFEYNDKGDSIELTMYTGNDDAIVIPSHINGKPVTDVSFDMLGNYRLVIFPATVTSITGEVGRLIYSLVFAIELVFTALAFVVTMLVLNLKMPKLSAANEYHLSGPQVILSFVYLIAQSVFAVLAIYRLDLSPFICLVISAAMFALYLLTVSMAGTGRSHAIKTEERELAKTAWMDELRAQTANLSADIKDRDVRKAVERVVEEIKYSDPSSNDASYEIERQIQDEVNLLKSTIETGDTEAIRNECNSLMSLLRERNAVLKQSK